VVSILSLRFGIAAGVLVALMRLRRQRWPRGRLLAGLVALGSLVYVGQSLAFFSALTVASASLVAVLFYLYPAMVTVLARVAFGHRLSRRALVALGLALTGTALTVGPVGGGAALGAAAAVAAALFYSAYLVLSSRLAPRAGALASTSVIVCSAAAVYVAAALVTRPDYPAGAVGVVAGVGIALISTVVAVGALFAGMERIGPTDAATVSAMEPAVTIGLAVVLLAESVTALQLFGGALVLCAVVLLARARRPAPPVGAAGAAVDGTAVDGTAVDGAGRQRPAG
jgi:drug/metabolite transporter (DMT)-like permease